MRLLVFFVLIGESKKEIIFPIYKIVLILWFIFVLATSEELLFFVSIVLCVEVEKNTG